MKVNNPSFIRLGLLLNLALLAALTSSCGGKGGGGGFGPDFLASQNRCPKVGMVSLPTNCCDASFHQINFNGACSLASATTPPLLGALTGAATAGMVANSANAAANQLIGNTGKVTTGGTIAAASGGNLVTITPPTKSSLTDKTSPVLAAAQASRSGRAGGGGGDSGAALGLSGQDTDGSTRGLSAEGSGKVGLMAATAGVAGGGAGSGVGSFRMPASGGSGSGYSDYNGGGAGGGNPETLGFNGAPGTNPLGSSDPEDYFTRVNLDQNIFKVVEKRYQAKALGWASLEINRKFDKPKLDIEGLK